MLETHRGHKIIFNDFLQENDNNTYILLMFDINTLIGMARINLLNDHYYINMVHIHTSQRGKGLCTVLMKYLINFCVNDLRYHMIKLDVDSDNEPAIRCYTKVGFNIIGEMEHGAKKIANMKYIIQRAGNNRKNKHVKLFT